MHHGGIGESVPPAANTRYVRGLGNYTDDLSLPREAVMLVIRSPHAAADIVSMDLQGVRSQPGVIAVLTGEEAVADGLGPIRTRVKRKHPSGTEHVEPPFPLLAVDRVAHVGFPVAIIIAESLASARDAEAHVRIEYAARPAVTGTRDLLKGDAPQVWPQAPGNVCFEHVAGDHAAVDAAFRRAAHKVVAELEVSRVVAAPMEPRNAIGYFDARDARYTLWTGNQSPHDLRAELSAIMGISESRLAIVSPDIGGAFGLKISPTPELALVLWASRRTGRPVRWQADRSENFLADWHARDTLSTVELALDGQGTFLALRVTTVANLGAYLCGLTLHSPTNNLGGLAGPYRTPAIAAKVIGAFSNCCPTAPYRGAGRPEATYAIEHVIDVAARQTGMDRIGLRLRNLISPDQLPFKTGLEFTYDSGDFRTNMLGAMGMADWKGFPLRRRKAVRMNRLRGIGLANAIEIAGGPAAAPLDDFVELRFDSTGEATILTGLHSHGHGLETMFRQVLSSQLGLPHDAVRVVFGDTDTVYRGHGSGGSRSGAVGSLLCLRAAERIIEKGRTVASHVLEADGSDLTFEDGAFSVRGTDLRLALAEVAALAHRPGALPPGIDQGLMATVAVAPAAATFPNGCHVCEVEIDMETGQVHVVGYWTVEDVGKVLNPLIVDGQIQGGVAQGLGQALLERIHYDADGQLISASFMDYAMPRASDVPSVASRFNEVVTKANPLGVKGVGEAGTVGALTAAMSAVNDALTAAGADPVQMPASPERVWRSLQARRNAQASSGKNLLFGHGPTDDAPHRLGRGHEIGHGN